jgi:hypothetical protein
MSNERVRVITEEQYQEYLELKNQTNKNIRRWKPEYGEKYWIAGSDCECFPACWDDDLYDLGRYNLGCVFKTKQEAQKELDRRLAEQELLDLCDWKDEEPVYHILYDFRKDYFSPDWLNDIFSHYRFASLESCQKAINTLGHKKLKLIFRID